MERAYNITECDCCGIKKEGSFETLESDGWVKFSYKSTWQTGIHKGFIDHNKTICNKCNNGEGFRYFYLSIKNEVANKVRSLIK